MAAFRDRTEAGERLAERLSSDQLPDPVVLALPRGGVPVALPVARALDAPLDLLIVRKIGMPGHGELAAGALLDGDEPVMVWNRDILTASGLTPADLGATVARERREAEARRAKYLFGRPPVPVKGRTAVVVDDGIATGATMRAALTGLRARGPAAIVLAVPVAPADTLGALAPLVDRTVCLATPSPFHAVGAHYDRFEQTGDAEVISALDRANAKGTGN